MSTVLIDRLVNELGYPLLTEANFQDFVSAQPFSVLFFTEAPQRFPETQDVAVILPELVQAFPQLTPAVIAREAEKTLQARYGFTTWPTLVFLREGQYLGAISKVQNWDDYLRQIESLLRLIPRPDPGHDKPMTVNAAPSPCGH